MNTSDRETAGQKPAEKDAAGERFSLPLKPLIVFAVIGIGLAIVYFSPLRGYLTHFKEIKAQLRALGYAGPLIYMLCVFVLISLGFPRLLFCPIGGLTFGFVEGLLWTQIATLMGYYVIFLFVRWGGRDFVLKRWPKVGRMHQVLHKRAIPTILLMRQLPISGLVINLLLGISPISHMDFLIGTAIGLLPEAIPFTLVASGAVKLRGGESTLYIVAAAVVLILIWGGFSYYAKKSGLFAELKDDLDEDKKDKK